MSDCIGPTNIIPNNNEVVLQDVNRTITVIDNNCCTTVTVTQPVVETIQVNVLGPQGPIGPQGPTGAQGPQGPSVPFNDIGNDIYATTSSIEITGSLDITGSLTVNTINVGQNTINFIDENETTITSLFVSGSDLVLSTGSIITSGGFFLGTASYALNVTNIDTASLVNTGSFNDLTSSFNSFTSSYNTGSFTGSLTGELIGTSSWAYNAVTADNAASVTLIPGPGIDINGLEITASVRTINSISPDSNGNVAINLTAVLTGDSASLVAQDTSSIAEATVWVISGDSTPANNGDTYIFRSSSVGEWLPIAPLDTAAADARYLKLTPQSPLAGDLNLGNNDITNGRLITATGFTGSLFGTASWANNSIQAISASFLPVGTYNITSSWAQTSSRALTSSFLPIGTYQVTSSWAISASRALTSSLALSASSIFVNGAAGGAQVPLLTRGNVGVLGTLGNTSVFEVSGVTINTTTRLLSGVTASWAQSASQALTASRALLYTETDPVFIAKEGSLVTTSSFNTFTSSIQNQVTSLTNATSSYVQNSQTGSFATTSSFNALTSSFNNFTSSYNTGSFTGSLTGELIGTSSWAQRAITSSYITGSSFTSTNPALSASYALTASFALNGGGGNIDTSALVNTASFNAYTESINTFTQSYYIDSSSFVGSISNLDSLTIALVDAFSNQTSQISSLEAFSSSIKNFTSSINTFTQSYYTDSASFATQINNINVDTSFLVTTASFNSFTSSINTFTSSYNTGSFTGSLTGELIGTASWAQNAVVAQTANSVNLIQGPGITINGLAITASVRTVNNISPDSNGNIPVSLVAVLTGTSASLATYSTAGLADGTVWIVSGDSNPTNDGDAYILDSGSVGVWLPIAPLDQAAGDARYLMLNPQSSLTGNLNLGNNNITNGGSITATSFTGSLLGTSSWANNFNETDPIFLSKEGSLITTSSFNNLTSSFNNFTSSYQTDSSSFNTRIDSLTNATSSYVQNSQTSSFVVNSQTSSFTTTSSFNNFTSSYQTDSSSFNSRIDSINNSTGAFAVTSSTNYFKATQYITSSQGKIVLDPIGLLNVNGKFYVSNQTALDSYIEIVSGSGDGSGDRITIGFNSAYGLKPAIYGVNAFFPYDARLIEFPVPSDGANSKVTFYLPISASLGITSSLFGTSSWAQRAITSSYITGSTFTSTNPALSSSYALTASYALNGGGGGPTLPGGSNTQIQYNNNNIFGGVPTLTYDGTTLSATGSFTGSFTGPVLVTSDTTDTLRPLVFTTTGASENKSLFFDGDATNDLAYNSNSKTLRIGGTNNSTGIVSSSVFYSKYSAAFPFVGFIGTASFAQSASVSTSSSLATSASYITGSVFTSTNPVLSASYASSSSIAEIASKIIISPVSANESRVLFTSNYNSGDISVDNAGGDFIYNPSTNVLTVAGAVSSSTFFSTTSPGVGFIGTSSFAQSASVSVSSSIALTSSLAITSSTTQIAAGTFGTYNLLPYTNTSTAQNGSYPLSFSTRLAFNSNLGSLRLTPNSTSTTPTLIVSSSTTGNTAVAINGSLIVSGSNGAGVFSKGGTIADLVNGVSTTGSYAVWRAPFPCQVVAIYGRRSGGTACQINASRNGTLHSATNLLLSTDNTWTPVPTIQNTSYTIGDSLEIIISGSANNQVAVQVDFIKV